MRKEHEVCGYPLDDWPPHKCTDWPAHSKQPEHAEHYGWSCYVCNGPCGKPTFLLPRCGDTGNEYGIPCAWHEGHVWPYEHGASLRWGSTRLPTR